MKWLETLVESKLVERALNVLENTGDIFNRIIQERESLLRRTLDLIDLNMELNNIIKQHEQTIRILRNRVTELELINE